MNTANHLSEEDLSLYALQLLPDDERAAASEHLEHCELCRRKIGAIQGDLVLYAMTSEMHTPPALARERLLRRVAQEKRIVPVEKPVLAIAQAANAEPVLAGRRGGVLDFDPHHAERSPFHGLVTWGGWAIAAGFAVAFFLQTHQRELLQGSLAAERARVNTVQESASASQVELSALTDPGALNVTLRQPTARGAEAPATPEGHAAYLPDRGALVFVATNLEPLQPYKVYELWLLPAEEDRPPIPAASFYPDSAGNANVILPTGPKFVSVKGFGVTVEDDNSPAKQPTLPILLMGSSKS